MRPTPVLLLLALVALTSCRNVTPAGVHLASTPPGARVLIDGRYAGYVTPCLIALDEHERYRVTLELSGYESRDVVLDPASHMAFVGWRDGRLSPNGGSSGLWKSAVDLFQPIRIDDSHSPSRVFVRLRPVAAE